MKKLDKFSKILYTITYGIATLIMFFIWLFLVKNFSLKKGFDKILMIIFFIGMLLGIYSNACQIVKLYNEDVGKKMLRIFSAMYYIVFIVIWFAFLIYFDYTIINDWNDGSILLLLFSLLFYIPGIILIKKIIKKIKGDRYL